MFIALNVGRKTDELPKEAPSEDACFERKRKYSASTEVPLSDLKGVSACADVF